MSTHVDSLTPLAITAADPIPVMESVTARPLPQLYYLPRTKTYFREANDGRWIELNNASAGDWLVTQGLSSERVTGSGLNEVRQCLVDVQSMQSIDYAGPLAGYDAGCYLMNGNRILVTNSPTFIDPEAGDWSRLRGVFERMLGAEQLPYFYGWMKLALDGYRQRKWVPAQILVLAGPPGSGKSLLLSLCRQLFGGRQESPYQYLCGGTTFNSEMLGAEHLVLDDESEARDLPSRRELGAKLKQLSVSKSHRCHPKYQQALTLEPRWRVTIALNDEPERLQVLPPLDPDIADKIMLLRVSPGCMPMPTETAEQQETFWAALMGELPAFVHYLENYQIPEPLRAPRFGIQTFHHPSLVELIAETKREHSLLELLDAIAPWRELPDGRRGWTGTATELTKVLHNNPDYGSQGKALVTNANHCGTHLLRLQRGNESRVSSTKAHNVNRYTLLAPSNAEGGRQRNGLFAFQVATRTQGTELPVVPCPSNN